LKTYDALFILQGSLKDEAVEEMVRRIGEEVAKLGGAVRETRMMGKRAFSRPLKKRETGHYVRMHIDMAPSAVEALTPRFKLMEDIFRAQIVAGVAPSPAPAAEKKKEEAGGGS
jgi:ribosomal protein S6